MRTATTLPTLTILALATCVAPQPTAPPVLTIPSAAPPPSASVAPPPAPSVAPTAIVQRPKLPVRSSTPGKIECETQDCDLASEVCCIVETNGERVARCAKREDGASTPCCVKDASGQCNFEGATIDRRCDEASDCPAGTRCCASGAGEGMLATDRCEARCEDERCLPGSSCVNGNACSAEDGKLEGECPLAVSPPKCGAKTCAKGQSCCWDEGQKSARCAAACELDHEIAFLCTSPEQCAPYDCNVYPGARNYRCGGGGFRGGVLCRTAKDCTDQLSALGYGGSQPHLHGCAHTADLPPGVKACQYQ